VQRSSWVPISDIPARGFILQYLPQAQQGGMGRPAWGVREPGLQYDPQVQQAHHSSWGVGVPGGLYPAQAVGPHRPHEGPHHGTWLVYTFDTCLVYA
jgi:hypothetical protein